MDATDFWQTARLAHNPCSQLAREATLHHPSALVKVSEREIVFAPGTEYSLSIKASSAKPSSSSPEDEAASKPTRPLNIAFESSTTTTDSVCPRSCSLSPDYRS